VTRLRLRDAAVSWREVDGDIVALDVDALVYVSTNGSGAVLWKMLADGATREELVERLSADFTVETARATEDVDLFLGQLRSQGLLEG
jgi:hypothetical protein